MAKASPLCLIYLFVFYFSVGIAKSGSTTNFIKTSCSTTTYPTVCVQSLSSYASKIQTSTRQLALVALSLSLDCAQSTKTFVSKLAKLKELKSREYAAIKDCIEEIKDSVDRISQSVQELKNIGKYKGQDFSFHMSNAQTWVSAAITDENTCLDGFEGKALNGKTKTSIRTKVLNLIQLTSNALALCNRFAEKYHKD